MLGLQKQPAFLGADQAVFHHVSHADAGIDPDNPRRAFERVRGAHAGFQLPGELFGLDAVGSGHHRCEAIALVDSSVCEIPFDRLTEIASHIPGLQFQLMRVIGQSVSRDQDHMAMLLRRQAHERLAMFLMGLRERLEILGQRNDVFRLPMSREDIAAYLGLALETVSRAFGRLQDDGIIHVHGRSIEVLSAEALDACAHGEQTPPSAGRRCAARSQG